MARSKYALQGDQMSKIKPPAKPQPQPLPPVKIAFVIDGKVVDVIHTEERMAAILLSQPQIIEATDWVKENPGEYLVGYNFDGENFTK
jgi:hypothetical protein